MHIQSDTHPVIRNVERATFLLEKYGHVDTPHKKYFCVEAICSGGGYRSIPRLGASNLTSVIQNIIDKEAMVKRVVCRILIRPLGHKKVSAKLINSHRIY